MINDRNVEILQKFVQNAEKKIKEGSSVIESIEIADAFGEDYLNQPNQSLFAVELFNRMLQIYLSNADTLMATMVISRSDGKSIYFHKLEDAIKDNVIHPHYGPEIYLTKRQVNNKPYIVEEYKCPISQNLVKAKDGYVYSYYRSHRNNPEDDYLEGFYFEHYPKSDLNPWE